MKIAQSTVKGISSAIREQGEHQPLSDGSEVYLLEDASISFGPDGQGKLVFKGLSFEMAGREFHVLSNLDLVLSEESLESAGENDVYSIEDERLVALADEYLLWRTRLLGELGL